MWKGKDSRVERIERFFYLMMCYNTLYNYYSTSLIMKRELGYDMFEQGEMTPFDREIYLSMIIAKEEEKKKKMSSTELYDPQGLANRP